MQAAEQRRARSIESRLRRIVLVPMAALTAVWLMISGYLGYGAAMQYAVVKANEEMMTPAAIALTSVMDERSATVAYLERPDETRDVLEQARAESDRHMEEILDKFEGVLPMSPEPVQERIHTLDEEFGKIQAVRDRVDQNDASRSDVLDYYNALTEAGADLFDGQSRVNPSREAVGPGLSATYAFRAVDTLAQADAHLSRAFATGELSEKDREEFTRLVGSYRTTLNSVNEFLGPEIQHTLDDLRGGSDWAKLTELEREIAGRTVETDTDPLTGEESQNLAMPVGEDEWREVYDPVKDTLTELGAEQAMWGGALQERQANQAIALAVAGFVGIAVLGVLSFTFTTRSARNLAGRLNRLRDETQQLTEHGLPEVLERARRSEGAPVRTEPLQVSGGADDDEIGQVARSFNSAHRTAVDEAIRQAEVRQGANRVFLNIAHRSQTLIHRQLRLLDKMEREQEDPGQLTDLFKLDHLATRSRRNAENLLILGGESPGHTRHRPMPLIDVLRASISESGDYTRVNRERIARVSLKGSAVADVIHLVAELVDNATTFSPPHTQVRLSSDQVPNGVTVEIEDRGLGMQEEEFKAANALLAQPPEFDVMRLNERMRLGLFVVSRLAHRHGIGVWLRGSPYGGVQAIVLLPPEIVADDTPSLPAPDEEDEAVPDTGPAVSHSHVPTESGTGAGQGNTAEGSFGGGTLVPGSGSEDNVEPLLRPVGPPPEGARPQEPSGLTKRDVRDGGPAKPPPDAGGGDSADALPEVPSEGRPKLPKRTPQANLAPQLHDEPSVTSSTSGESGTDEDRSCRLRRNMAAFQQGTHRGRLEGRQRQNENGKDS